MSSSNGALQQIQTPARALDTKNSCEDLTAVQVDVNAIEVALQSPGADIEIVLQPPSLLPLPPAVPDIPPLSSAITWSEFNNRKIDGPFFHSGMVIDMANTDDGYGNPTMLSNKKSLYSVLPDRPTNINTVRKIPLNVVAAEGWDTSFANAQLFTKFPKAEQDREHEKYRLASDSQRKACSKAVCKLYKRRPDRDAEEEGGDHVASILNRRDSLVDWNTIILIS